MAFFLRTCPAAFMVAACLAGYAEGQDVCRPNALGAVTCTGPHVPAPMPRPVLDVRKRGLEKVQAAPGAQPGPPAFVPARRTNRLGSTLPEGRVTGPCRRDNLGNLRCR